MTLVQMGLPKRTSELTTPMEGTPVLRVLRNDFGGFTFDECDCDAPRLQAKFKWWLIVPAFSVSVRRIFVDEDVKRVVCVFDAASEHTGQRRRETDRLPGESRFRSSGICRIG